MLNLAGNGQFGVFGQLVEQLGVGDVGAGVAAGPDPQARVEVAVGEVVFDGVEVAQNQAQRGDGTKNALDVERLGLRLGALDGEEFEYTEFREEIDEAGEEMAAKAWSLAVGFPVIVV